MKLRKGQQGLSLIEVTIMLLVLMLLTSVLAPSIFDFIKDAQWVKVKEDCEAIAISVARLHRDVGANLYTDPAGRTSYADFKLDLLLSDGKKPLIDLAMAPDVSGFPGGVVNWYAVGTSTTFPSSHVDSCEHQLITNATAGGAAIYPEPTAPLFGPFFGQGWRGAYLSPPCASDPWGNTYQVNTKWATTTFSGGFHPEKRFHCNDVFCLSPGPDATISTPYGVNFGVYPQGTRRGGDDWTTVIAPCDP
jgi:type II secretory pathway pseudopilin PulG